MLVNRLCRKIITIPLLAGAGISVTDVLVKQGEILDGTRAVLKMNHENGGFDCPGCAWPDDRKGLRLDICENGIKHSAWEMTRKRVTAGFLRDSHGDRSDEVVRLCT